jgi:hypothetical protein
MELFSPFMLDGMRTCTHTKQQQQQQQMMMAQSTHAAKELTWRSYQWGQQDKEGNLHFPTISSSTHSHQPTEIN